MKLKKTILQESDLIKLEEIEDKVIMEMGQICEGQLDMSCTIEKDLINRRLTITTLELQEQMN